MGKPKVELNSKQVRAALKNPAVQAELMRRAERIAAAAGPGFKATALHGTNRARASVITDTNAARRAEAKNGVLTRALEAGRG